MDLGQYLPFWDKLSSAEQETLSSATRERHFKKGELLHSGADNCIGLLLPISGQLRAYIITEEGKELTLYRLFERDMCLFSASCIMRSIQFDVLVSAETDTTLLHIPADVYKNLMEQSAPVANYTNELMASRFSDVMWLMDQILSKKLDSRLAAFLLEESRLMESPELHITHEQIAHHLGSVREVVTRMLQYFQTEQLIALTRGSIKLLDEKRLEKLAEVSLR
ncbi:MAG: Crp/Fnr family transcriptional regulator [Oscillospiraceae bacterium]